MPDERGALTLQGLGIQNRVTATEVAAAMEVPVANPKANYLAHKTEIDNAIHAVLERGSFILSDEVAGFEREFADFVGVAGAVGVGSGTDALELALRCCEVGPGDAVVTVSHTSVATVCAIHLTGATPILVDIDPVTFTLDPDRVEAALKSSIGSKVKAIVPVHLYGHPADMTGIMEISRRHDLFIIEDCAQAHGALWRQQKVGSIGHVGAFSFYPTKNLGALGDGGAVVSREPVLVSKARSMRQYGWKQRYVSETTGKNSRLDELQAAILRVKLHYLEQENRRRHTIAGSYSRRLSSYGFTVPEKAEGASHVYHQYVIRCQKRDELRDCMQRNRVGTAVLYPVPVHLQQGYRREVVVAGSLPQTEKACREILSLPMYPELGDEQVSMVTDTLLEWQRGETGS